MTQQVKLTGVKETQLFTLYYRALDARSAHPILGDTLAVETLGKIEFNDLKMRLTSGDRYGVVLRARRMDDWARDFLARHPDAVVLHLGCGLDSRAFRLDVPPGVSWFDLDFPEVIELRRSLYPARESYTTIPSSVTELSWLDEVPADRPVLVIGEGVIEYLAEADVMRLFGTLSERFPAGGELICDTIPPWLAKLSRPFYRMWGLGDARSIERRFPRLTLLEERPVTADHALIHDSALYRGLYRTMSHSRLFRDAIRPLRYAITAPAE